jgi:hypothetical protein
MYIELMRAGLGYNRKDGTFFLKEAENADDAKYLLQKILKEEVIFAQRCFICESSFTCYSCAYKEKCGTSDLPLYCVCYQCRTKTNLYNLYLEKSNEINVMK